jgi:hypothetical protein
MRFAVACIAACEALIAAAGFMSVCAACTHILTRDPRLRWDITVWLGATVLQLLALCCSCWRCEGLVLNALNWEAP